MRLLRLSSGFFTSICSKSNSASLKPQFILYSSDDCSLCVHFKNHLKDYFRRKEVSYEVEEKDIRKCEPEIFEVCVITICKNKMTIFRSSSTIFLSW